MADNGAQQQLRGAVGLPDFVSFHRRYLFEMPVEGENLEVVFDGDGGDSYIGERQGVALASKRAG